MHAVVVTLEIDEAVLDRAALAKVREQRIVQLRALPGFVSGYWVAAMEGRSMNFFVFETEADARDGIEAAGIRPDHSPSPGALVVSVDFRPVSAHT